MTQKLLQREVRISFVFSVGGRHICVTTELWCPLQLLGGKSAEVMYEALRRWEPWVLQKHAPSFQRVTRLFVTDGDGAIAHFIREYRHDYEGRAVHHVICTLHRIAICRDKPATLFEQDVSRIIQIALFLHQGGKMSDLRACMLRIFCERLRILRGWAGEGAA